MKVCLGLHDFSVVNNRLDLLLKLKEIYPGFKVSLFTIPIDEKRDFGPYLNRKEYLKEIKENLDWIQIIPHGLTHNSSKEMLVDYKLFKTKILPAIKNAFEKDGLPYEKGFCAPHFKWSKDVVKVLNDEGWWGAVNLRKMPLNLVTKKFYNYSDLIDDIDLDKNILKLHGHIYGTKNDLGLCFNSLLPYIFKDATWHFVTEFLENKV